jgi:hypothetical protein
MHFMGQNSTTFVDAAHKPPENSRAIAVALATKLFELWFSDIVSSVDRRIKS